MWAPVQNPGSLLGLAVIVMLVDLLESTSIARCVEEGLWWLLWVVGGWLWVVVVSSLFVCVLLLTFSVFFLV
jgi:hypothetical protein